MFLLQSLGAKAAPPQVNLKATSKADILQALAQSYDFGTAALKEFNDAAMAQAVDGPRFLGRATRARIAHFAMSPPTAIYGARAAAATMMLAAITRPSTRSKKPSTARNAPMPITPSSSSVAPSTAASASA